jgi:hypothetical protein
MVVHPRYAMFTVFMDSFKSLSEGYDGREVTGC